MLKYSQTDVWDMGRMPQIFQRQESCHIRNLARFSKNHCVYFSVSFLCGDSNEDGNADDNPFAGIKLKKTITNDRSMPAILPSN